MKNDQNRYRFNPLIDDQPVNTLANAQAMLDIIQKFAVKSLPELSINPSKPCPGTALYRRLLKIVGEAVNYEIERLDED